MTDRSVAEIIARTICEWDRKVWGELGPTDRHRYFHAARLAQDRIRDALLDGPSGQRIAAELIGVAQPDTVTDFTNGDAFADRRFN